MKPVDIKTLNMRPFSVLDEDWALLVGGVERPNPMTVSWGGLGTLWNRPVVTVFVRPTRHTYGLLVDVPEFTLNFMAPAHRPALNLCGKQSGRDTDKWQASALHPAASEHIRVPRVAEARLSFECRIIHSWDVDPQRFTDPTIDRLYPQRDYHRAFIGEVLGAFQSWPRGCAIG
jgi:flavin reductase (DIM6/NTAB) family NADH-FMN oxidoreductase RutF